jgi:hypothetical protein
MKVTNKALVMGMTGAMALGLAFTASAQGSANTEVSTAHAHALLAQKATTVAQAQTHLHHVINCLVGANGDGFDAAAGTPCKGQGNGAIPDSASNQALHGKLESALADAQAGLKASDLKTAQAEAGKAAAALQATPAQKTSGGYSW